MRKSLDTLTLSEIDTLVREATENAIVDSLARGLPVSGIENGVVVTKFNDNPVFEHLTSQIDARRQALQK